MKIYFDLFDKIFSLGNRDFPYVFDKSLHFNPKIAGVSDTWLEAHRDMVAFCITLKEKFDIEFRVKYDLEPPSNNSSDIWIIDYRSYFNNCFWKSRWIPDLEYWKKMKKDF